MNAADAELPGPFNILVASNLSATAKDLPSALANMYDSVQEGRLPVPAGDDRCVKKACSCLSQLSCHMASPLYSIMISLTHS